MSEHKYQQEVKSVEAALPEHVSAHVGGTNTDRSAYEIACLREWRVARVS
jgi:hypothetical protein